MRSTGPAAARHDASRGPATSRRKTSRSTAAGVSRPNQATSPGPWLMGEKARVPPSPAAISTTNTGADGPMAVAMGTTVEWWLAGSRSTPPSAALSDRSHPSARTAARTDRRSGSHMSSHAMAGPQWRIVRSPISGTTSPARAMPTSMGTPVSSRRTTSALASSTAAPWRPYSRVRAATSSRSPPAGGRQSTWVTGRPWSRMASANKGSPRLTTDTSVGSSTAPLASGPLASGPLASGSLTMSPGPA